MRHPACQDQGARALFPDGSPKCTMMAARRFCNCFRVGRLRLRYSLRRWHLPPNTPAMSRDPLQSSHTKIVATVGPACSTREQLASLISAGVDVFRLNMAHAEPEAQQHNVEIIRYLSEEFDEPIAILIDLSGPKI